MRDEFESALDKSESMGEKLGDTVRKITSKYGVLAVTGVAILIFGTAVFISGMIKGASKK